MTVFRSETRTEKVRKAATKMSGDKRTTIAGMSAVILSVVTTMLPENIRQQCMDAVTQTDNPAVTASLLVGGVILTVWGPSLASKRA